MVVNLAREMKRIEHSIGNLQILIFLKKGYTDKQNPQVKLQLESIEENICPFCLNQINWKKLENLIAKHNEALQLAKKQLFELNNKLKADRDG